MKTKNNDHQLRYSTVAKHLNLPMNMRSVKGSYVVLTEQSILDLRDMVEDNVPAEDIVRLLKNIVQKCSNEGVYWGITFTLNAPKTQQKSFNHYSGDILWKT